MIFQIFNKILNLNYKSLPRNKIWICLINIINDICYTDLRYIELFIELFEYQLSHQINTHNNKQSNTDKEKDRLFKDDLINSGLKFLLKLSNQIIHGMFRLVTSPAIKIVDQININNRGTQRVETLSYTK